MGGLFLKSIAFDGSALELLVYEVRHLNHAQEIKCGTFQNIHSFHNLLTKSKSSVLSSPCFINGLILLGYDFTHIQVQATSHFKLSTPR